MTDYNEPVLIALDKQIAALEAKLAEANESFLPFSFIVNDEPAAVTDVGGGREGPRGRAQDP
jgi:hypothetical protein